MLTNVSTIAAAAVMASLLLFWKRFATSPSWLATVTPLSSIMGSGFLVCAPLLAQTVGIWAAPAMAGLLLLAYAIGSVTRFNIRFAEPLMARPDDEPENSADLRRDHSRFHGHSARARLSKRATHTGAIRRLETASHVILVGAYLISVTYYLKLLAEFVLRGLHGTEPSSTESATLSTAVIVVIAAVGALWGLGMLERVERFAVGINLSIIVALLIGLALYNVDAWIAGTWALPSLNPSTQPLQAGRVLLGLLIVVQGFETSLFLGNQHSAEQRIRTMRWAQGISSVVYIVFLSLCTILFDHVRGDDSGVTAVVALSGYAAAALPVMLVVSAAGSQFSAAVADDAGCGGLLSQLLGEHVSVRSAYIGIGIAAIGLTWCTNVIEIISIASRAFAVFYAAQCGVAILVALRAPEVSYKRTRTVFYAALLCLCMVVAIFGVSADG